VTTGRPLLRRSVRLLVATAVGLAACTSPAPPEPPPEPVPVEDPAEPRGDERAGGTLRIALVSDPFSIDPRFVSDAEGELVVGALFEPLVRLDDDLRVVPAAAESFEIDDEGREITFTLREATFHDGTPVTAADFARAFSRIADGTAEPLSFLAFLLEPVEGFDRAQVAGGGLAGVTAVDELTLTVRLVEPLPGFVATLANPSLVPLPAIADEDPTTFAAQPVGNGPFQLLEPYEPGEFLRLTAYPEHHRAPLVDEVLLSVYGDDPGRQRQWDDLVDGQLHVAQVAPERLDDAAERFGVAEDGYTGPGLLQGVTATVYLYGFDTTQEPFDDPRVRRAISLALDRDALADEVMQGTRLPADALVPPPIPGSQPGVCDHCRHAPDEARALLEEADVELEGLVLAHNRGATHAAIAERMAADIEAALDLEVELHADDLQGFVQGVRRGDTPVFRLGWEPTEPDPGAYLHPLFHSSQVGLENVTRYVNDDVDALLEEARAAEMVGTGLARYREAERLVLADAPVVPLLYYRHSIAIGPQVRDLRWPAMGRVDLTTAWLDGA
jgi:oligopeptide transport system substrate-binding protein